MPMDQKEIHDEAVVLLQRLWFRLKDRPDLGLDNRSVLVPLKMAASSPDYASPVGPQVDFAIHFIKTEIYPKITSDWSEVKAIAAEMSARSKSLTEDAI
jgi:hypothetical protein